MIYLFPLFLVLGAMIAFGGVWFGFRLGRKTLMIEDSKPKKFNPGDPNPEVEDPYEKALLGPEQGKRIATMPGEDEQ